MTTPLQTRRVLSEIPERVAIATTPTVEEFGDFPTATIIGNFNNNNNNNNINTLNNSLLATSRIEQSPDEIVIRQRGRRRISLIWSPDKNVTSSNQQRTPTKVNTLISTSTMVLRSSPRKRLLLNDSNSSTRNDISSPKKTESSSTSIRDSNASTPVNKNDDDIESGASSSSSTSDNLTPTIKRMRFDDSSAIAQINTSVPLPTMLKGLSQDQLIQIIRDMIRVEPHLEQKIRNEFPLPDLSCFEEQLNNLKKNIFKSLPSSRLSRKTDSMAYSRASVHLTDFKKTLLSHCRLLNDSKNWDALIDYVNMAWFYVRSTPIWDAHTHNLIRRQCFKVLSFYCTSALSSGGINLGQKRLLLLRKKIKTMSKDYEDIKQCLKKVDELLPE